MAFGTEPGWVLPDLLSPAVVPTGIKSGDGGTRAMSRGRGKLPVYTKEFTPQWVCFFAAGFRPFIFNDLVALFPEKQSFVSLSACACEVQRMSPPPRGHDTGVR